MTVDVTGIAQQATATDEDNGGVGNVAEGGINWNVSGENNVQNQVTCIIFSD